MNLAEEIETDGFALISGLVDSDRISNLRNAFNEIWVARSVRDKDIFGARNILKIPQIASLANDETILNTVSNLIGRQAICVRALFFDKTPRANWPVAWHQDLTLAIGKRIELPGWVNWSKKAGVDHVQPPPAMLERMITLRLHLDNCDADNGPLKVLPGTHRRGRIRPPEINVMRGQLAEHICAAPLGSGLLMKPLLLHASSAARKPHHRRVVHLEFAPIDILPAPLEWSQA